MKLTFLGSGSAFTLGSDNFQSNLLLERNDQRLLIDCGTDIRHSLNAFNLDFRDFQSVYISHLHSDHIGGLEWLGFSAKFHEKCAPPNLYIHESMIPSLWENALSAGMRSIKGIKCQLQTYFNTHPVQDKFIWEGVEFHCIQTIHVFDEFKQQPCYGLFFATGENTIFFTADTTFSKDLFMPYYQEATVIFQDCETSPMKSGVHAHYSELCTLDTEIKKKMWLYHYNHYPLPNPENEGFLGFVRPRQVFDFATK